MVALLKKSVVVLGGLPAVAPEDLREGFRGGSVEGEGGCAWRLAGGGPWALTLGERVVILVPLTHCLRMAISWLRFKGWGSVFLKLPWKFDH